MFFKSFKSNSVLKNPLRFISNESLDPEKLFLTPAINKLLHNITDSDPLKVHTSQIMKRKNPKIKLLTNAQYEKVKETKSSFTRQRLQMPPILKAREDNVTILEKNEKLNKLLSPGTKAIFVDINIKEQNRNRLMVVRESSGDLRTTTWDERDRLNQIYFPLPGRQSIPPPLFNTDNLQAILDEGRYMYILDLNCIQFEPDDPRYISIRNKTYNHIQANDDKLHGIRKLTSSRHFGGLVLHLVIWNKCSNLLLDLLATERFDAVENLFDIYALVHPDSSFTKCRLEMDENSDKFDEIRLFLDKTGVSTSKVSQIMFLVDSYRDSQRAHVAR